MNALLLGVQTRLRSAAVLDDATGKKCGVQDDGRPPPNFGQKYFAVHSLGTMNGDPNSLSNDRNYAVGVTITARMANVPQDRRGARSELLDLAEAIADALHQDDLSRIEANKLIAGTAEYVAINGGSETVNGFAEPLRFANYGPVIEMPGDWAGESSDGEEGSDEKNVLTVLVSFVEARRVRHL